MAPGPRGAGDRRGNVPVQPWTSCWEVSRVLLDPRGAGSEIPGCQGQASSSPQVHSDLALPTCSPEAERARPRQARSAAPMEGAVQLLSREGHTVSHNSKRHYHDAFVAMSRMRQRGLLCDIVLHVAAKEIRAHKVVLASCSPYFHAMFTSKYRLAWPGRAGGLCGPPRAGLG